jgi:ribosomal protein L2
VDFVRDEPGVHDVVRIEYDPGRSSHIALLKNRSPAAAGTQKWSYIIACDGLRAGDTVQSFRRGIPAGFVPGYDDSKRARTAEHDEEQSSLAIGILRTMTIKPGNVLPLRLIPTGTVIHNIALSPQGPGILVRSAGSFGQVVAHDDAGRYTQVRLQSGEVRKVLQECSATIGKVSNSLWKGRNLGKAGRARWLGRRPSVRGVAMNAYVFHRFAFPVLILVNYIGMTILMEVGVENQSRTSTQCRYGDGTPRANGHENLGRRDRRIAIRWSFARGLGERRSGITRYIGCTLFGRARYSFFFFGETKDD